jgi:glycerophosphoryl diester phosphodiesterase
MAAFHAAVALGYTHLETDSRASADGVAIAFHDDILDRLTNDRGRLVRLSWQAISRSRILGREPIPRLEEVLGEFASCQVNIDVKSDAAIGPTLDAIRRTKAWSRVRLAAFSDRRVRTLRRVAGPSVATSLAPSEVIALKAASFSRLPIQLPRRLPFGDLALQLPHELTFPTPSGTSGHLARVPMVDAALIDAAHRRGLPVHVWTVNAAAEMIRLLDLGVDAIMTDCADVLRTVLQERGQWIP